MLLFDLGQFVVQGSNCNDRKKAFFCTQLQRMHSLDYVNLYILKHVSTYSHIQKHPTTALIYWGLLVEFRNTLTCFASVSLQDNFLRKYASRLSRISILIHQPITKRTLYTGLLGQDPHFLHLLIQTFSNICPHKIRKLCED